MINLGLNSLVNHLETVEKSKKDVIVPSTRMCMIEGKLVVGENKFQDLFSGTGISSNLGSLIVKPSRLAHSQIAARLDIPKKYYDRMFNENMGLLDTNVNAWLANLEKKLLLRTYEGEEEGNLRAFLSNRYRCYDNIDVMYAVLEAVTKTGLQFNVEADLSETRMYLRFTTPEIVHRAANLVKGDGIMSGFVVENSEVGCGALQLSPRAVVLICQNGMKREKDVLRKVHAGEALNASMNWSKMTYKRLRQLIHSQVVDFVKYVTSHEYLSEFVAELEQKGDKPLQNPVDTVVNVTNQFSMDEGQKRNILNYFVRQGDTRAFGVTEALTYYAHQQQDPDFRYELESASLRFLDKVKEFDKPGERF